jgi:hypothetical protein
LNSQQFGRLWRDYGVETAVLLFGVSAMNAIFLASAFRIGSIERTAAGQLGDFVGGYVGTGLTLLSVLLLLATLKAQRLSAEREHFEASGQPFRDRFAWCVWAQALCSALARVAGTS